METDEEFGMSLLSPLRHEGLGPSRVDLELAVRQGQRRRRVRRAASMLGSGVLALVVITATIVTTSLLSKPVEPPVTGHPLGWGLDRQRISAAPPGYELTSVVVLRLTQRLSLIRRIDDQTVARITVTLNPPKTAVSGPMVPDETTVQGHSAYWSVWCDQPRCLGATLSWEWSSGNWVSVSASVDATHETPASERPDARTEAIRVAEAVQTDVSLPVRTPVLAPAPPGTHLEAVASELTPDGSIRRVSLFFVDQTLDQSESFATVTLRNDYTYTASEPTSVVAGKPAYVSPALPDGSPESITVPRWAGDWALELRSSPGRPFADTATRVAYAGQVTTVPDPEDRSSWIPLAA
jgi:hypothetical protein